MVDTDMQRPNAREETDEAPTSAEIHALIDDDLGEDDVPTVVLYIIAGLLFLSFTLYLVVGGGHSHFH
jgi:hypothetical protein